MSYEDFKQEMKNRCLTQRVIREEVTEKMSVKHEDLEKYYNEHKTEFVRDEQIYLAGNPDLHRRQGCRGRSGRRKESQGSGGARPQGRTICRNGPRQFRFRQRQTMGELPPYKKGVLSKNLEDLVWTSPRATSPIRFKIHNGFLILRVEDHQKAGQAELSEVENRINEKLLAPRLDAAVRELSHQVAQGCILRDQGRLHRYRRGGRQRYRLGGSRSAQTRNSEEGRG